MFKIIDKVDIDDILSYYKSIEDRILWTNYTKGKQASVQYKTGEDPATSGLGKGNNTDLEYTHLNEFYKSSIFESLIHKYKLKRTRLMLVEPWACYSMHRDSTPRIHIPIITNPETYFVFKIGFITHLPAGNAYWVDTTKLHTFMNCSNEIRVHLMGSVERE